MVFANVTTVLLGVRGSSWEIIFAKVQLPYLEISSFFIQLSYGDFNVFFLVKRLCLNEEGIPKRYCR
jgi:hypothetical protein